MRVLIISIAMISLLSAQRNVSIYEKVTDLLKAERARRLELREKHPEMYHLREVSEYEKGLIEVGYNGLPAVVDFVQKETDPIIRQEFGRIIKGTGRFRFYTYAQEHTTWPYDLYDDDTTSLPFLNRLVDPRDTSKVLWPEDETALLVEWAKRRDTFLNRGDVCAEIRSVTGETAADFAAVDHHRWRQFTKKFAQYGIYNLPYYIQAIGQDNNPLVFAEFVIEYARDKYDGALVSRDAIERIRNADKVYPKVEDKRAVVAAWWAQKQHTLTEFPRLYQAIDNAVRTFCPTEP